MVTDYIRKAIELADGWEMESELGELDALAAELVRRVVLIEGFDVVVCNGESAVMDPLWKCAGNAQGPDRTMNTIKAIVDSGVLE